MCNVINTLPNAACSFEVLASPEHGGQAAIDDYHRHPERVLKANFAEQFRKYPKAPCVWGFKVFPEHVTNASLSWIWKNTKKAIILERRNITAQYVSLQRAIATGCWKGAG